MGFKQFKTNPNHSNDGRPFDNQILHLRKENHNQQEWDPYLFVEVALVEETRSSLAQFHLLSLV